MGRSYSPSVSSKRQKERSERKKRRERRSREREIERKSTRKTTRDTDRDTERNNKRSRSRSRSRELLRRRSTRSRSRSREQRDQPSTSSTSYHHKSSKSSIQHQRTDFSEADFAGKSAEEIELMKTMGFGNFDSTKNKKVDGNDVGEVHVILKRKYRQYMNRKGGFNRPLDFVA